MNNNRVSKQLSTSNAKKVIKQSKNESINSNGEKLVSTKTVYDDGSFIIEEHILEGDTLVPSRRVEYMPPRNKIETPNAELELKSQLTTDTSPPLKTLHDEKNAKDLDDRIAAKIAKNSIDAKPEVVTISTASTARFYPIACAASDLNNTVSVSVMKPSSESTTTKLSPSGPKIVYDNRCITIPENTAGGVSDGFSNSFEGKQRGTSTNTTGKRIEIVYKNSVTFSRPNEVENNPNNIQERMTPIIDTQNRDVDDDEGHTLDHESYEEPSTLSGPTFFAEAVLVDDQAPSENEKLLEKQKYNRRLIIVLAFILCILLVVAVAVVTIVVVTKNNSNGSNQPQSNQTPSTKPSIKPSSMTSHAPSKMPSKAPTSQGYNTILTHYLEQVESNSFYGQCVTLADSGDKVFASTDFDTHIYSFNKQSITKVWTIPGRCDGIALSKNADIVAIANDRYENFKGSVRVYRKQSDNSWDQRGRTLVGTAEYDMFGKDVSISSDGNVLAIGTGGGGGSDGSYVGVYSWNGSDWDEGTKIIGTDGSYFGWSVSISNDGTILAIGAVIAGYAEVYKWNGNQWNLHGKRLTSSSTGTTWFGRNIMMSSDGMIVVVSAVKELNAKGVVRVYDWNGSEYIQRSMFTGLMDGNEAGWSMALSGDGSILAIGTWNDQSDTRVFKWDGTGWNNIPPPLDGGDWPQMDMTNDGRMLVIGLPTRDEMAENFGRVTVYSRV